MTQYPPTRRSFGLLACSLLALGLGACQSDGKIGADTVAGQKPSGTVEMQQVQAAYIASGSGGEGVLTVAGRRYPFSVGGGGVGGIGASTIDAQGEVYNLRNVAQFAGAYGQTRRGIALGTTSAGDMWLQNEAGVIMHLRAKRSGLMLSLGADAIVITMK